MPSNALWHNTLWHTVTFWREDLDIIKSTTPNRTVSSRANIAALSPYWTLSPVQLICQPASWQDLHRIRNLWFEEMRGNLHKLTISSHFCTLDELNSLGAVSQLNDGVSVQAHVRALRCIFSKITRGADVYELGICGEAVCMVNKRSMKKEKLPPPLLRHNSLHLYSNSVRDALEWAGG